MTDKEYQKKINDLDKVETISTKLFQKTGRIAYYGAVCAARDLKREYLRDRNSQISEK